MVAREQTIKKLTLAFVVVCLLAITPQSVLSQDVEQFNQQGIATQDEEDFSEQLTIFHIVVTVRSNNETDVYVNLGNALYDQGKLEEAIASYQQAIQLNPSYSIAYISLGNALYNQGKLEEAIASYQKAIQLNPSDAIAIAYINLGTALLAQEKLEEAIANYQKAIQLNPNYINAYIGLGLAKYDQGKLEVAIANYQQAIELDPNYALPYNGLGAAKYNQGKLEEAIANYQKAIQLNPNYAIAYNNLGLALRNQGKLEEAIASYEKSIQLEPSHADVYNGLGYTLQQQGELEEAIQQYKLSLEIDPEYILAKNNLREAERLLAIQLDPPLPDIDDTQHLPSVEDEPLVNVLRSTTRIIAQVSGEGIFIGAGWVVKKEGNTVWIVTNRHVVSDKKTKIHSKKIEVEFFSELSDAERPRYPATIINSTERNDSLDLAVLEVTGIPDDIQALAMGSGRVQRNANTLIIGHPHTIIDPWSVSSGGVINFNPNNPIMSIDANVAQGNSGGPVIDSNNKVIGVMVALRTNFDIAFAPNQATPNIDANQPATGGVGLAYRIDVVVEKLREWGVIN